MRLEGWQHGTDSRPSFETRVSATQKRRRYALLRMRVYPAAKLAWARKIDALRVCFFLGALATSNPDLLRALDGFVGFTIWRAFA
jgi:hypothetical protein